MNDFEFSEDIMLIIDRFENMVNSKKQQYFDVVEFVEIIDFYIENIDFNEALNAVKYAFIQHPNSYDIYEKQAEIFISTNKAKQSLKILELLGTETYEIQLLKASAYLLVGNKEKFNEYINICVSQNTNDTFDFIYKIAVAYISSNKWFNNAILFLNQALNIIKDNYFIYNDLAICYEGLEDNKKAIYYSKKYLDIDPFDETTWFNLGIIYEKILNYTKALEAFEYTIAINEKYIPAYLKISGIYITLEQIPKAIDMYTELLEIVDSKQEIYCLIGECYENISSFEEAYNYYTKALKIDDKYADAWFGLGVVKYETNETFESLYFIKRAIELDKENDEFYFQLGKVYEKLDFLPELMESYEKALELNPQDEEYRYTLADKYFFSNKVEKAIETLLFDNVETTNSAEIQYRLAFYYAKIQNVKLSLFHFQLALDLDSEFELYENISLKFDEVIKTKTFNNVIKKTKNKWVKNST